MNSSRRAVKRYASRKKLGRKPGAVPGGINRKTRERLKGEANKIVETKRQRYLEQRAIEAEARFFKSIREKPAFARKIKVLLDRLKIKRPIERGLVLSACSQVLQDVKMTRFRVHGLELLLEQRGNRIKAVRAGTGNVPSSYKGGVGRERYARVLDADQARTQELVGRVTQELRALISNPPMEFQILYGARAKAQWIEFREIVFAE